MEEYPEMSVGHREGACENANNRGDDLSWDCELVRRIIEPGAHKGDRDQEMVNFAYEPKSEVVMNNFPWNHTRFHQILDRVIKQILYDRY